MHSNIHPVDDFNYNKEVKRLSENIDQPDKFADLFCQAATKQKSIEKVLKDTTKDLTLNDKDINDHIKKLIIEVNKEDWKIFIKKFGTFIWVIGGAIGGVFITLITQIISKKFGIS